MISQNSLLKPTFRVLLDRVLLLPLPIYSCSYLLPLLHSPCFSMLSKSKVFEDADLVVFFFVPLLKYLLDTAFIPLVQATVS